MNGARTSALGLVGLSTLTVAAVLTVATVGATSAPPDSEVPVATAEPSPTEPSEPVPSTEPQPSIAPPSSDPVEPSEVPGSEPAVPPSSDANVPGSSDAEGPASSDVEGPASSDVEVPATSAASTESDGSPMVLAAAAPAGPTQVVAPSSAIGDVTPNGRWVLTLDRLSGAATRTDLTTGTSVPSPVAGLLTDDGQAVIGLPYDPMTGLSVLLRYDFATGTTRTIDLLPAEWLPSELNSISGNGRYIAVWASNPIAGAVAVFVIDTVSGTAVRPGRWSATPKVRGTPACPGTARSSPSTAATPGSAVRSASTSGWCATASPSWRARR